MFVLGYQPLICCGVVDPCWWQSCPCQVTSRPWLVALACGALLRGRGNVPARGGLACPAWAGRLRGGSGPRCRKSGGVWRARASLAALLVETGDIPLWTACATTAPAKASGLGEVRGSMAAGPGTRPPARPWARPPNVKKYAKNMQENMKKICHRPRRSETCGQKCDKNMKNICAPSAKSRKI